MLAVCLKPLDRADDVGGISVFYVRTRLIQFLYILTMAKRVEIERAEIVALMPIKVRFFR